MVVRNHVLCHVEIDDLIVQYYLLSTSNKICLNLVIAFVNPLKYFSNSHFCCCLMFIKYLYKKGCTRLAAASDKVYQLLAHGRWFSPSTPASSTTKTGHHDIREILLKVALKHQKSNQIKSK